MTESAATAAVQSEVAQYLQVWAESLAQVLGQITSTPLPCSLLTEAPAELAPAADGDLWTLGACSGGLRGEMSLRLPASSVVRLAQRFMSEPVAPDIPITPEHREATLELLRQVAGVVATAIKPAWGDVQLHLEPSSGSPSWPASAAAWVRVGEADALVEIDLSAALVAAMRATKSQTAPPPDQSAASAADNQVKLDLLMDVELGVTLRFGSRRLLLREVLELNPGSVVDLDRQVKEPVDLLLDGRLIARGEVVVMDGNYGVRLTEIGPPIH
jgi:flagellar motor switch protein FliN/FliY